MSAKARMGGTMSKSLGVKMDIDGSKGKATVFVEEWDTLCDFPYAHSR